MNSSDSSKIRSLLTEEFLRKAYIEEERSTTDIGDEFGLHRITVGNYLNLHGIPIRPRGCPQKYSRMDVSEFRVLTDDWHAYWVGFIAADGTICDRKDAPFLCLQLSNKDEELLHKFVKGTGIQHPIVSYMNGGSALSFGLHPAVKVTICDRALVDALALWGVTARKSLTLQWPDKLPEELIPSYIRGFFDGDGTVYQRYRRTKEHHQGWTETSCRFISGSTAFLDRLQSELYKRGIKTNKGYKNMTNNAHVLPLSGSRTNLLAFADLIYRDSTVHLERKRQIFDTLRGDA